MAAEGQPGGSLGLKQWGFSYIGISPKNGTMSVSKSEHSHKCVREALRSCIWDNGPVNPRVRFRVPHLTQLAPPHLLYMHCACVYTAVQPSYSSAGRSLTKQQALIRKTSLQTGLRQGLHFCLVALVPCRARGHLETHSCAHWPLPGDHMHYVLCVPEYYVRRNSLDGLVPSRQAQPGCKSENVSPAGHSGTYLQSQHLES